MTRHNPSQVSRAVRSRAGFTFAEVMFAVILLGIGFIMLAGMFPVAIQQTRVTQEETIAANLAQTAKHYIEDAAWDAEMVSTSGQLAILPKPTWLRVAPNVINAQDRRYAWTALYRRASGENVAQLVILPLQCRNTPEFQYPDDANANFDPIQIHIKSLTNANAVNNFGADRVVFSSSTDLPPFLKVATGAFLVLDAPRGVQIYRLGNRRSDIDDATWELAPGYDMADDTENVNPSKGVDAFIVGRGLDYDLNAPSGLSMDIGAYVTFIHLK